MGNPWMSAALRLRGRRFTLQLLPVDAALERVSIWWKRNRRAGLSKGARAGTGAGIAGTPDAGQGVSGAGSVGP
ncbi:hypothetical protein FAIPA1_60220 [Frankia sp. AiPs1]